MSAAASPPPFSLVFGYILQARLELLAQMVLPAQPAKELGLQIQAIILIFCCFILVTNATVGYARRASSNPKALSAAMGNRAQCCQPEELFSETTLLK